MYFIYIDLKFCERVAIGADCYFQKREVATQGCTCHRIYCSLLLLKTLKLIVVVVT
jgi:hypothetical protein